MPDPTEPTEPITDLPEGLTLEEPPSSGSKNEHVRAYRTWLEAHPKTSVKLPDFTGDDGAATKAAQATAAAFNRIDHMHATFQTITPQLARVWVVFDPDKVREKRGEAKKASATKKAAAGS